MADFRHASSMTSSLRSIHVVAGVITDARGRILLNRREGNRDLTGLWEFPGGKREPGETSEQALIRELHEELGIDAQVGEWLMEVPQLYPDKRLRLEVRRITGWTGRARGKEGQAIMWVAPEKLHRYSMPPADLPILALLRQPDRYLLAPSTDDLDGESWLAGLERAVEAGISRIQLRLPADVNQADLMRSAIARHGRDAQLLVHRDIALAQELGVGVHLGSEQLSTLDERPIPAGLPLSATCHDLAQLRHAQALGCDFAMLGPVAASEIHPGTSPMGWAMFEQLREQVSIPLYASGGLGPDDIIEARRHGAHGIAATHALWPR